MINTRPTAPIKMTGRLPYLATMDTIKALNVQNDFLDKQIHFSTVINIQRNRKKSIVTILTKVIY